MRLVFSFGAVALMTLAACAPGGVCGMREEPLHSSDGGALACVRGEDCPLTPDAPVCDTREGPSFECVLCRAGQCVRRLPERCG